MTTFRVGDVVIVDKPVLDNPGGTKGLVVEVYKMGGRPGWTILFPNGNHDGFSVEDCRVSGVRQLAHKTGFERYNFTSAMRLLSDFRRGLFAEVWE